MSMCGRKWVEIDVSVAQATAESIVLHQGKMPKRKVEEPEVEEAEEDNSEEGTSGSDSDGGSGSDDGSSSSDGDDDGFPDVSDKGEEDEDDEEGEKQEEIVINFEFFPPKEIDFHGLRSLLTTYLDGQQYDVSGLVNSILKQVRHAVSTEPLLCTQRGQRDTAHVHARASCNSRLQWQWHNTCRPLAFKCRT